MCSASITCQQAIVFAGTLSSEGRDRASLSLDDGLSGANAQNALIAAVAAAQKDTVVVLTVPGAILCPWNSAVKAIITNFMPGKYTCLRVCGCAGGCMGVWWERGQSKTGSGPLIRICTFPFLVPR